MDINTKKIGKFLEVYFQDGNTTINTGLLNLSEAILLKCTLQNTIDDINRVFDIEDRDEEA